MMSKLKVISVLGTRPEAIKMAPLILKLNNDIYFEHKVCSTGQHKELLEQALKIFNITPDYNLNVMKNNQGIHDITSEVILGTKKIFDDFKPDLVLVHGDTTTSFAASLSAFYSKIKIGHIEAGMRTWNINSPFPEEANRVFIGKIANYHFAATDTNVQNLIREGVEKDDIIKTGNTVIDSLFHVLNKIETNSLEFISPEISEVINSGLKVILVTGHRRENFGEGFINICDALIEVTKRNKDAVVVFPVHLNPNVRNIVFKKMSGVDRIHLIEPLPYETFVYLMKKSYMILTDSGGIQEEAPSLRKPVLVMRNETERPEAVAVGAVRLIGSNRDKIVEETSRLLSDVNFYNKMSQSTNPYGDGHASEKIIDFIKNKI